MDKMQKKRANSRFYNEAKSLLTARRQSLQPAVNRYLRELRKTIRKNIRAGRQDEDGFVAVVRAGGNPQLMEVTREVAYLALNRLKDEGFIIREMAYSDSFSISLY